MFKKLLMWTIYAGVVGLLIFGAVIRTEAKTGQNIFDLESSQEREDNVPNDKSAGDPPGSSRGYERKEASSGEGEDFRQVETADHDWTGISGTVASMVAESLWIQQPDDEMLEIAGRAWRFIQESEFVVSPGDQVGLEGFFENGEYKVSMIWNLTTDSDLQIRDDSGRPLWGGGAGK